MIRNGPAGKLLLNLPLIGRAGFPRKETVQGLNQGGIRQGSGDEGREAAPFLRENPGEQGRQVSLILLQQEGSQGGHIRQLTDGGGSAHIIHGISTG